MKKPNARSALRDYNNSGMSGGNYSRAGAATGNGGYARPMTGGAAGPGNSALSGKEEKYKN